MLTVGVVHLSFGEGFAAFVERDLKIMWLSGVKFVTILFTRSVKSSVLVTARSVLHMYLTYRSNLCGKLIIGEKEIYHPMQSVCTVNKLVGVWSVWQVSNVAGVDRWLIALVNSCYPKNVDLVIFTSCCYHHMLSQCQMSPCGGLVHRTGVILLHQEVCRLVW